MKNFNTYQSKSNARSNFSRSITVFFLTLVIIINSVSFSLANRSETNSWMRHAAHLSQTGNNEEALKIFLKITHKEPNNYYAYNNLGMVYSQIKENEKALNAYE